MIAIISMVSSMTMNIIVTLSMPKPFLIVYAFTLENEAQPIGWFHDFSSKACYFVRLQEDMKILI